MPTIEVDETDQVFVFKGRGSEPGGYHELGINDLLLTVQVRASEEDIRDTAELVPYTRIYIGGTRIVGFERFSLSLNREVTPITSLSNMEFVYPRGWTDYPTMGRVYSLEPFVNLQFSDIDGTTQATEGLTVRVSRYQREPVI